MRPIIRPSAPLVRYVGGKWRMAPWIISFFPAHRVYVEPFGGMASVLLRKQRSEREIYNDLDLGVVTLFRVMRDRKQAAELIHQLKHTPFSRAEFKLSFEDSKDPVEKARRLIVRCMQGFAGGAKVSKGFKGGTNHTGHDPAILSWRNYVDRLPAIIERLQGVVIENEDAIKVMQTHDGLDVLHYIDPPYLLDGGASKLEYYNCSLTLGQHKHMLACLRELQGMVVVSGFDNDLYHKALDGWRVLKKECIGMGDPGEAPNATEEILWINKQVQRRLRLGTLF